MFHLHSAQKEHTEHYRTDAHSYRHTRFDNDERADRAARQQHGQNAFKGTIRVAGRSLRGNTNESLELSGDARMLRLHA